MTSSAQAVNTLKNKMQAVRDELERYRELYDDKCQQHLQQIDKHNLVSVAFDNF